MTVPCNRWEQIKKLNSDGQYLALLPYEIHCGKHSGFPDCCIRFFISRWISKDLDSKFCNDHRAKLEKLGSKHPGYIPCPKCLKNRTFNKVLLCPRNCKKKILIFGKKWWLNKPHRKDK